MTDNKNLFVGLMSGTSMDAIDTVLVEITTSAINVIGYHQYSIPASIQDVFRKVNSSASLYDISKLDIVIAELFADSVRKLLSDHRKIADRICAIGSHGQTILHLPEEDKPRTMQIGDPSTIAFQTGITTVADFRRMDIAAGGQGAPLACAFHNWYFRDPKINRVILNIGGMANITILSADQNQDVIGFDTGPGNALMDDWTQKHSAKDYDENGQWAATGQYRQELLEALVEDPYFKTTPPKSTGKDEFNLSWLEKKIAQITTNVSSADVQATLLELTACTISNAIKDTAKETREVLVCGGGIHNDVLVERLSDLLPELTICSTEKYGIAPDAVEAITFAWLAKCRLENKTANLPSVTGANSKAILGGIYEAN